MPLASDEVVTSAMLLAAVDVDLVVRHGGRTLRAQAGLCAWARCSGNLISEHCHRTVPSRNTQTATRLHMDAWVVGAYAGGVPGSGLTLDGDLAFIQRRVGVPLPIRASRGRIAIIWGRLTHATAALQSTRASPTAAVRRAGHPCRRLRMAASSPRTRAP